MDDTLHSATIDGHGLLNRTWVYVENLAHEYNVHNHILETIEAIETHIPRESYALLMGAIAVMLLRRAIVTVGVWRVVKKHVKVD